MSYDLTTSYPLSILRSIVLPTIDPSQKRKDEDIAPTIRSDKWTATTHSFLGTANRVVPSCWPPERFNDDPVHIPHDVSHNTPYVAESAQAQPSGSKESLYSIYQDAALPSSIEQGMQPPRLVAKRYIPNKRRSASIPSRGLTLLMLSGMGLPKEAFEPMIDTLITKHETGDITIAEIWTIDMPMSGQTALANPLGYLYGNEKDVTRDVLLFITAYLPLEHVDKLPGTLIPRRPDGRVRPDLHAAGHSLGGQSAMLIAAHAPRIFSSLTVFDPAVIPSGKVQKAFTALPKEVLCTNIPYLHESREALDAELRSNKRTRGWDDRIIKIFVEHAAVVSKEDGKVRLASHPRLEWALYYDQETPSHCYDRLQDIRTPFNAIMPARPFAVPPKMFEADIAKLPQETRLTFIPDTTHQLPFERVDECTELFATWLKDKTHKASQQTSKL